MPADGAAIAAIYAPIVAQTAISFEETPPDAATMQARVEQHPPDKPWLVAERDGRVVGYAYASVFRARYAYRFGAEVTVYVVADARRGGTARRLYPALFALLCAQGYRRAFAGITQPNAASTALHAALGFAPVGTFAATGYKFGRWHDVAFHALTLAELDRPERDPLPLCQLERAAIEAILGDAR